MPKYKLRIEGEEQKSYSPANDNDGEFMINMDDDPFGMNQSPNVPRGERSAPSQPQADQSNNSAPKRSAPAKGQKKAAPAKEQKKAPPEKEQPKPASKKTLLEIIADPDEKKPEQKIAAEPEKKEPPQKKPPLPRRVPKIVKDDDEDEMQMQEPYSGPFKRPEDGGLLDIMFDDDEDIDALSPKQVDITGANAHRVEFAGIEDHPFVVPPEAPKKQSAPDEAQPQKKEPEQEKVPEQEPLDINPMEDDPVETDDRDLALKTYEAMHIADEKSPEEQLVDSANRAMFMSKLGDFNKIYNVDINPEEFELRLTEAWKLMWAGSKTGSENLKDMFKDMLKQAFDAESSASYEEWREPDYADVTKSANELLRAGMFAFTDMYTDTKGKQLFEQTAFGGMNAKEISELTANSAAWSGDQRSNEAWEKQSMPAVNISIKWTQTSDPYATMMNELRHLAENPPTTDRNEALNKLAAAELMLMSDPKMMVEDPEDPFKDVPDWSNRYWRALSKTRESMGIPTHISMRELIQGNYAGIQKAANNANYHEKQLEEKLLSKESRLSNDSMEKQVEEFLIQREGLTINEQSSLERTQGLDIEADRVKIEVKECDERRIMSQAPKSPPIIPEQTLTRDLHTSV